MEIWKWWLSGLSGLVVKVIDEHTGRYDGSTPEHVSDGRNTGIRTVTYRYRGTWLRASVRTSSRLEEELR